LAMKKNVQLGEDSSPLTERTDIRYTDIAPVDMIGLHRTVKMDVTKPIYFGWTNPVVIHLLKMCGSLADINGHIENSYMFCTRIRWLMQWTMTPPPYDPIAPPPLISEVVVPPVV